MQTVTRRQPKYQSVYLTDQYLGNIIDKYSAILARFREAGWDAYVFTFKFSQLRGSTEERRAREMAREVVKFYGAIAKRLVGDKRPNDDDLGYFPVGVFFPHMPTLGRARRTTTFKPGRHVNELHMRGVLIANRWKRLRTFLDRDIAKNGDLYAKRKIRNFHVKRLNSDVNAGDAVEYVLDGLRERIFIPDDIMILDLGSSSLKPSAWPDLDTCSGYDGHAVFPSGF